MVTAAKSFADLCSFTMKVLSQTSAWLWRAVLGILGGHNVVDYGADPTGAKDSWAAFQECLTTAGAYGRVYIPEGYYKIGGELLFFTGQLIEGMSGGAQGGDIRGSYIVRIGDGAIFKPANAGQTNNVCFRNLRLQGSPTTSYGVMLLRCAYSEITNCLIALCDVGVLLDSLGGQCYFNNLSRNNVAYNRVVNYRFDNGANANNVIGDTTGGAPRSMEFLNSSAANTCLGVWAQGQIAPDDTLVHFYVDAPANKFFGCYCEGSSKPGTATSGSTTTAVVAGLAATVNQYAGYRVNVMTGGAAGQQAVILSNTSDTLTFTAALSLPIAAGDTMLITRTTGIKITRNGSIHSDGMTWGGGLAVAVDEGGAASITGTATGGAAAVPSVSAPTIFVDGLTTTTNQYQFYTVEITGGTGSGQVRLINATSFSAGRTTFFVTQEWSAVPDGTSTFQLYEPRAFAYIRNDLKGTDGTGDPQYQFQLGVLQMESAPNGATVPFDWNMRSPQGVENVLFRYGRKVKTEGLARMEFWYNNALNSTIDLKTGDFVHNSNFGSVRLAVAARFTGGTNQGNLQAYDGATYVSGIRFDASVVAGDTRLLVYDVTKGAVSRVSVGAADSGGAGFKLLRVPN